LSFVILFVVILVILISLNGNKEFENKLKKCPGIKDTNWGHYGRDIDFVDCMGIISIDRWNRSLSDTLYNFRDFKHDYYFAGINDLSQYGVVNDFLYVKDFDKYEGYVIYDDGAKHYTQNFLTDGKVKQYLYDSPDEIPRFRKVNVQTGEITLYKTFDEMPESDRKIFEELEKVK